MTWPLSDPSTTSTSTLAERSTCWRRCARPAPSRPSSICPPTRCTATPRTRIKLRELPTRWDYDDAAYSAGIAEDFSIDQSKHSLFGASKLAGDIMVQEYGRYFGLPCCCLRGGCLTGPAHSAVELHGFLSYLVKVNVTEGSLPGVRLQGKTGPRQHSFPRRRAFRRGIHLPPRAWPRSTTAAAAVRTPARSWRRSPMSKPDRQADAMGVRGQGSRRRPHLLHQRPEEDAQPLPELGNHKTLDDIFEEIVDAWLIRVGHGRAQK